jgi:hypothetical protein
MLSDACFEFCSQLLDVIRPVHAVLLLRGLLASFHKNLRFCDLCKELAFGTPESLRPNQDFIQLVRAQHVLPPVPGEKCSEFPAMLERTSRYLAQCPELFSNRVAV